jgi:hypothetical protein
MTMTQQQLAGENARRTLGHLVEAASVAEMRNQLLVGLTVYRNGSPWSDDAAIDTMSAVGTIRREQRAAQDAGHRLAFAIRPIFPTVSVTEEGPTFTDEPAAGPKPVYNHDRTEAKVREHFRNLGYNGPYRTRHDEAIGGGVQTIITADEGGGNRWSSAHWDWMNRHADELPGVTRCVPWGDQGVKIIWPGVR